MSAETISVAVFYGGKSAEHDVSVQSGTTICQLAKENGYQVIPVYIDKESRWLLQAAAGETDTAARRVLPAPGSDRPALISYTDGSDGLRLEFDAAFPILHGPMGEDGTLQGLFEICGIPYAGCGVLASAAGMDKEICKQIAKTSGVNVLPDLIIERENWDIETAGKTAAEFGYPVFVKPLCMGSSVGISRVATETELKPALEKAFKYDRRIMIEKGVDHARELMCGVLGRGDSISVSVCGEITAINGAFFDYNSKYESSHGFTLPADIPDNTAKLAKEYSVKVFSGIRGEGFARADFLLHPKTGELFFGEINTAPGFTAQSLYPQLFAASGTTPKAVVARLITMALARRSEAAMVSVQR